MTETREFHLGDILSVTTGRLVSPRHLDGVWDILNFMTGDSLFIHALPRAKRVCTPFLLRQFPELAAADLAEDFTFTGEAHATSWLAEQVARFGQTRHVAPIPAGEYSRVDPLVEMIEMREG